MTTRTTIMQGPGWVIYDRYYPPAQPERIPIRMHIGLSQVVFFLVWCAMWDIWPDIALRILLWSIIVEVLARRDWQFNARSLREVLSHVS